MKTFFLSSVIKSSKFSSLLCNLWASFANIHEHNTVVHTPSAQRFFGTMETISFVLFFYIYFCENCDLFEYLDGAFLFRAAQRIDGERTKQQKKSREEMMRWNTATNNCVMTFEMDFYVVLLKLSINKLLRSIPDRCWVLFIREWLPMIGDDHLPFVIVKFKRNVD